MTRGRIDVHVDRLVLHGLSAGDVRGVERAVEAELTRLLAGGAAVGSDTSAFQLGREPAAQAIGARVAARVHGSIAQ